jgi:general secretion pathway protein G
MRAQEFMIGRNHLQGSSASVRRKPRHSRERVNPLEMGPRLLGDDGVYCFHLCGWSVRRYRLRMTGFTFVELMASIAILMLLTTVALPLARIQIQRTKEVELRRDLREMREVIDHYKDFADHQMIPVKADTFGYPPDLQTLVDGVELKGSATAKYKFLRKIPVDPMTESADWGMRSMQDDPDSRSWGGQNVFDVFSKSDGIALDGTKYSDW